MAVHPSLDVCSVARARTFLLGYSEDARALIAHLHAEAPWIAAGVRVLDPDASVARALRARGVNAAVADLWDDAALCAEGLPDAATAVVFAERVGGSMDRYRDFLRTLCPAADVSIVPRGGGVWPKPEAPPSRTAQVVKSWRSWLRAAARFLDRLAEAR